MEPCRTWPAGAPPPLHKTRSKLKVKIVLDSLIPHNPASRSDAVNVLHCSLVAALTQLTIAMTSFTISMQKQALAPAHANNDDKNNNDDNNNTEEDPVNENNDSNDVNNTCMPPHDDDDNEMSFHSSDAWSKHECESESDSFHSSDAWSKREDERAYESDDSQFDTIDWRPETPPNIGCLPVTFSIDAQYSPMHDDLYFRPLLGTAPVSCAPGTLPTMSVGDLARRIIDHIYECSCKRYKHTDTSISERARNPGFHKHTHYIYTWQYIANREYCEEDFEKGCRALPASDYGQKQR